MTKAATAAQKVLELPCEFKGLTGGKTTCGIGVEVSRANLSLETADELFVGKQLNLKLILKERIEQPDQTVIMKTAAELDGTFDTSTCKNGKDSFSTKLSGNLDRIDIAMLAKFSNREGFLHVLGHDPEPAAKA